MSNVNEDRIEFGEFVLTDTSEIDKPKYTLILCEANESEVCELETIKDFSLSRSVLGVDEIEFRVDKYVFGAQGDKKQNPVYEEIKGNRLVKLNEVDFFILTKPVISVQGGDIPYKTIKGYSREYELGQKLMDGFRGQSRVIYDPLNKVDENGIEVGFLNYVENNTSWTVGYVNGDILQKHRELNLDTNILRACNEVQKTFGCIIQYDTMKKEINVYDVMQLGTNRGLYISDENYISEIVQKFEDEELVTRLYLYGAENISVQSISPTGQPYIEDFSYFMASGLMSEGLVLGLKKRQIAIDDVDGKIKDKNKEIQRVLKDNTRLEIEKKEASGEVRIAEHELDLLLAKKGVTQSELARARRIISEKETVVAEKQKGITNNNFKIARLRDEVKILAQTTELEKFLTHKEIQELDYFVKEQKFVDSNYTRELLPELMAEGESMLRRLSQPRVDFDVSVDDFLNMVEGRFMWSRFRLGDIVTLEHKDVGFDYEVRLIGYTHTPEEASLELKFGSVHSIFDPSMYLEELLEEAIDVSSTLDFNKFKWDKGDEANTQINKYINQNLDLSLQALEKAEGQKPLLDDRGLWLYKENKDGTVSPEQMRAINNVIALTKDNWRTVDVAISPTMGINATLVNGKLGNFVTINANQVFVGDHDDENIVDHFEDELNKEVDKMTENLNALEDDIKKSFDDGWVTNIEANGIKLALNKVVNESSSIITQGEDLGLTTSVNEYKKKLRTLEAYLNRKWIDQSHYPIEVTRADRITLSLYFTDTEKAQGKLVRDIADAYEEKMTEYFNQQLDEQVAKIDESILSLQTILSESFSDEWLTNIEANSVGLALEEVMAEASVLIKQGESLNVTTAVTQYKNAVNYLNKVIRDKWINQPKYPVKLKSFDRTILRGAFSDIETTQGRLVQDIRDAYMDENAVLLDKTYNYVTISKELGVQVKDRYDRERVRLGNYAKNKYGLLIKDPYGNKTIMDEDGMLQVWQDSRADNTDKGHPLVVPIYIPQNTRHIYDVRLRVKTQKFRSYSETAEDNKVVVTTAEDGGGNIHTGGMWSEGETINLSSTGGTTSGTTSSGYTDDRELGFHSVQTDNSETHTGAHNHGIREGSTWLVRSRDDWSGNWVQREVSWAPSGAHKHANHYHEFDIPDHEHRISMPEHDHRIYLPDHKHEVQIKPHTHPIRHGIYEKHTFSEYEVWVNSKYVTSSYWSETNIDITPYMRTGWNEIEISTNDIHRIDATVFCQCLLNFDGLS